MPVPGATVPVFRPLNGSYRIGPLIGEGGYGEVFLGQHIRLNEHVAIKVMRAEFTSSAEVAARFEQEAQVLARLRSPHIVSVRDVGTMDDGRTFVVMDWVDGPSLRHLLDTEDLSLATAVRIGSQVLEALSVAHHQGVLHRDLKPENVLLTQQERHVRVVDFGLAKLTNETSGHTRGDFIVGTPRYMAPEQTMGQVGGPTVDLYAVGLLLFEMVTGQAAALGDGPDEWVLWQVHGELAPMVLPSGVRAPAALIAVVTKATAKQPADRWQTAEEMRRALHAVVLPKVRTRRPVLYPTLAILLGAGALTFSRSKNKSVPPAASAAMTTDGSPLAAAPSPAVQQVDAAPDTPPVMPSNTAATKSSVKPSSVAPVIHENDLVQEMRARAALQASGSLDDRRRLARVLENAGKRSEAKVQWRIVLGQVPGDREAGAALERLER